MSVGESRSNWADVTYNSPHLALSTGTKPSFPHDQSLRLCRLSAKSLAFSPSSVLSMINCGSQRGCVTDNLLAFAATEKYLTSSLSGVEGLKSLLRKSGVRLPYAGESRRSRRYEDKEVPKEIFRPGKFKKVFAAAVAELPPLVLLAVTASLTLGVSAELSDEEVLCALEEEEGLDSCRAFAASSCCLRVRRGALREYGSLDSFSGEEDDLLSPPAASLAAAAATLATSPMPMLARLHESEEEEECER